MRVVAILAVWNEERFIEGCLDHLVSQGVEAYVIDNESTDSTRSIVEGFRGRGLAGLESFPRDGRYEWKPMLERKEQLARTLRADWIMHVDADEIHLPPPGFSTLAAALEDVDRRGFNAVNFQEFTFVPVLESPDHDHPRFRETMRWYYPFLPFSPHLLRAWKRREDATLSASGGHQIDFEGRRIFPEKFPMRHYLFLSVEHAVRKYVHKVYDEAEVARGWHGWRAHIAEDAIRLPSAAELRELSIDGLLDASEPRTRHLLQDLWLELQSTTSPGSRAPRT